MSQFKIISLSETALTIDFGNVINDEVNERVLDLYNAIVLKHEKLWVDLIPAYSSLTIIYEPHLKKKIQDLIDEIKIRLSQSVETAKSKTRLLRVPVCYDVVFGYDLKLVCGHHKISIEELVHLHTKEIYKVFMIGFLPGFAYMGSVDDRLATARLEKPR